MTRTSMRARYAGIWCTENCGTPKTDGCRCSRPQMVLPFPFMHRVHVDQIGRENAVGLRAAVADGVVATDAGELVLVLVLVLEPPQAASAVTKKNAAAAKRSGRPVAMPWPAALPGLAGRAAGDGGLAGPSCRGGEMGGG